MTLPTTTSTTLIECTPQSLDAEDVAGSAAARLLGVAEAASWPPEYNGPETRDWVRRQLLTRPHTAGWLSFYVVASIDGIPTLAGTAGYKGPPDANGMVEIGYSIVEDYRRRGVATGAVNLLLERAFADPRVMAVTAETPLDFHKSRGLLEKCGFALVGTRTDLEDGELALYAMRRSEQL